MSRNELYAGGAKVKTVAKLPYPLAQTSRVLPPGVTMSFSLKKATDNFILLTDTPAKNFKFNITDIWMQAIARTPEPEIFRKFVSNLTSPRAVARYPFIRRAIGGPFQLGTKQKTFSQTIFRKSPF